MDLDKAMIAVGLGFQRHATEADLIAAVDAALANTAIRRADVSMFATAQFKKGSKTVEAAARRFGVDVRYIEKHSLSATEDRLLTRSSRSAAHTGASCLSEAAALAALGERSRLLAARTIHGPVTCALATEVAQ